MDVEPGWVLGHDGGEVTDTSYICDGEPGVPTLMDVAVEGPGTNCAQGGVFVTSGPDSDSDGVLSVGEIVSSSYICNGESAVGGVLSVTSFNADPQIYVPSAGASVTVQSATLTVPGPGTVIALGGADCFCWSGGGTDYDCMGGTGSGFLTISSSSSASADTGNRAYFWLQADATAPVTRTNTFPVSAPGTYTYYLRGLAETFEVGFWRGEITLLYIAD